MPVFLWELGTDTGDSPGHRPANLACSSEEETVPGSNKMRVKGQWLMLSYEPHIHSYDTYKQVHTYKYTQAHIHTHTKIKIIKFVG